MSPDGSKRPGVGLGADLLRTIPLTNGSTAGCIRAQGSTVNPDLLRQEAGVGWATCSLTTSQVTLQLLGWGSGLGNPLLWTAAKALIRWGPPSCTQVGHGQGPQGQHQPLLSEQTLVLGRRRNVKITSAQGNRGAEPLCAWTLCTVPCRKARGQGCPPGSHSWGKGNCLDGAGRTSGELSRTRSHHLPSGFFPPSPRPVQGSLLLLRSTPVPRAQGSALPHT